AAHRGGRLYAAASEHATPEPAEPIHRGPGRQHRAARIDRRPAAAAARTDRAPGRSEPGRRPRQLREEREHGSAEYSAGQHAILEGDELEGVYGADGSYPEPN